ncbi:hypothetical protein LGV61_10280 [Desulfurispirillum indicum]|uniref:Uncharacterized protein n=1 Tax=Desulfurispirillum indicum (strain ATCC BAA-1389 / DSM 22839 / S5) TaxID=653733 RepID=E6W2W3_DESIS|nr:hypothetical protein [Desulfurispirillum indicum]ADU66788.1 hypothetical protein Selin_2068 [Desulfurispirillum indicum S5]UCZ56108.1 hypothetical protein LGV61_10280 [Desulfurispirillum indicum]
MAILLICTFTLLLNIPLGYLRQNYAKFSIGWLVCIHASIPLIIYLRVLRDLGWGYIPLTIAAAVAGQMVGGSLHRRRHMAA